ncbi:MAG: YceI family protein [Ginsengibacter sp.]
MSKEKWISDPAHSEIYFKVKHLMISTVTGYFKNFTVEAFTEKDDFTKATGIEFTAEVDSIDTKNPGRDNHLKSADFFDAAKHSHIKFSGTSYNGTKNSGTLTGNLTIKKVTKSISINVEFGGTTFDGYGQEKAGFSIEGKLSRKDFGITWDTVTEAGNVVVSDEVKFFAEIQLIKEKEALVENSQAITENQVVDAY